MELFIKTDYFNPELTLTGGQAFRWKRIDDDRYAGITGNRAVEVKRETDGIRIIEAGDNDEDCDRRLAGWENYFDINTNYITIINLFSEDAVLCKACSSLYGLRLLKQEPFETLISFIISQNNNIPRITGIIERLCRVYGEQLGDELYAFPAAETLVQADLSAIGAGYRAGYITDAARRVKDGGIDLDALYTLSADEARCELMKIKGVGEKVADCVLLFAYGKHAAFPKDVHVKRALSEFYPDGLPECVRGHEGLAQQFLFEYIRSRR